MTQPAGTATGTGDPAGATGTATATDPNASTSTDADGKPKASDGLERDLHKERQKSQQLAKELDELKTANLSDAEKAVKERDTLKTENGELKKVNKRQELALKLGLPWSIGKRITGDTDEEMKADAEELRKEFVKDDKGNSTTRSRETGRKPETTNDAGKTGNQTGKSDPNQLLRDLYNSR